MDNCADVITDVRIDFILKSIKRQSCAFLSAWWHARDSEMILKGSFLLDDLEGVFIIEKIKITPIIYTL